ncbi:hypothetical protein A1O1_04051 [Capronia coronata CBS 617.96]|uniref:Citrate transporter-like domain-containing protein n=1 Tax=Capronia coronata CBS 617.96 TaxID=1182541 RepID=W9Z8W5_9EURO|nr:uncharacterized protein A1O1_04051 [Capronia coronata CBS 617.96]EXJ90944.1 hypothetical protein A1O1_04051 [Capronia coronata CBS 617.96]
MPENLDTSQIKSWRSIVTLVVFVLTNITVLFPWHIPIFVPLPLANAVLNTLRSWRVIGPPDNRFDNEGKDGVPRKVGYFVRLQFPMNFVTAPFVADLFLLAISAIGRQEVHDGTIGANNISPVDIMIFFLTLAYIAISIDASGLIRYLAFRVLKKGGKVGHQLFFYLYAFFFGLGSFIGNDPIILSGTAFLAYMTRVSKNIMHPRAWIVSQFAVANTASAILVSSNPTNLVLAGAFKIKFINYTANMIVPVVVTAIVLFPFLLYVVFADERLIPLSIVTRELPDELKTQTPRNPNIPYARGNAEEAVMTAASNEKGKLLLLAEIMHPFLDKKGATFGAVIMAVTLITLLALNAVSQSQGEHPVFWVTLPAAFVMFCWDVTFGFLNRKQTRENARQGPLDVEPAGSGAENGEVQEKSGHEEQVEKDDLSESTGPTTAHLEHPSPPGSGLTVFGRGSKPASASPSIHDSSDSMLVPRDDRFDRLSIGVIGTTEEKGKSVHVDSSSIPPRTPQDATHVELIDEQPSTSELELEVACRQNRERATLVSLVSDGYRWLRISFPTVTAVVAHLPFMLVPFALSMFVLVQALVTKGWVPVFAHGWDHWVNKTGTIGSIGGMGFLSVVLCNFAGTNIGSTILLSRVIQAWEEIHRVNGVPLSDRTFWATVYTMALGVNYGAFSMAFSASLAGLLWRDILERKHITVGRLEFAWWNLPIIAIAMAVGCAVLTAEVYIMRDDSPYKS